ncbi:MAG: addiction module antidote protein, HigA family [Candidatus Melainabacteria bacterium RIFOXYA12_FULL_32_12]|nr:MAG: addiction module antidote protein, HigA family [Candidatus Melainabacteria bacterium RIFOXYA12_FULL_32_12]
MDYEKLGIMFDPPHPGEIIKEEYLEPLGITITEAALKLGVTRKALSELVNGKSGISPKMAVKLSKAFNTSPQMWLNMQSQYDLWHELQTYQPDDVEVMHKAG